MRVASGIQQSLDDIQGLAQCRRNVQRGPASLMFPCVRIGSGLQQCPHRAWERRDDPLRAKLGAGLGEKPDEIRDSV